MSESYSPSDIELLVPWDLPIEQQLDQSSKNRLKILLNQFLEALKQTSSSEALILVNEILKSLETIETSKVTISSTKVSLKNWEIEDSDNYFCVSHIQTPKPAICLVKSLIVAYYKFLKICCQNTQLNPGKIEIQKKGFLTYALLLGRVFHLSLEAISND